MNTPSLTQQHRGWTLLVTSLSVFMLLLDINVVNVALPEIRKELDASFTQLQWVLDAYALGLAAILVAAGSLADRIGRRRIFTIGFVIFTLASLACGLAWNVNVLIVSRFIQGIGGAILFAVGPALLGYLFDQHTAWNHRADYHTHPSYGITFRSHPTAGPYGSSVVFYLPDTACPRAPSG